jgi:hypothetical protein
MKAHRRSDGYRQVHYEDRHTKSGTHRWNAATLDFMGRPEMGTDDDIKYTLFILNDIRLWAVMALWKMQDSEKLQDARIRPLVPD